MELKTYWTKFAKSQLIIIFEYYKINTSVDIARKIVSEITIESKKIALNPDSGQIEELLSLFKSEYRYWIFKNYKIVYLKDLNRNRLEIHDIFDTRQNPKKILRQK